MLFYVWFYDRANVNSYEVQTCSALSVELLALHYSSKFFICQVKLQKHNTEVAGIKYRNGLHCAARILKTEGVWFLNFV